MNDPVQDEAVARARFFTIGLTRLFGGILVILGIAVVTHKIAWSMAAGYIALITGLIGTFILPQLLIKRWRSPPE